MSVLDLPTPNFMADEELGMFRASVGRFIDAHASPEHVQRWRNNGIVDRETWIKAAQAGLLGLSLPEEFGGAGGDIRHETVLMDELGKRGVEGWDIPLHNVIVAPYISHFGTADQKQRWLPGLCNGEFLAAIAMTEPGAGSDLQAIRTTARRDCSDYVINGQKTFISCGQTANLIAVVVKTTPSAGSKGISIIVVETDKVLGFERGRNLHKIGREAADASELFFDDVRVPCENLLGGEEGRGFAQLMQNLPQERLVIAVQGVAAIKYALGLTIDYVKERKAFGKSIIDFQNTQFVLAECKTEATIAQAFVDRCVELQFEGRLDGPTASMAKYWVSELQSRITDRCLQFFGGYGYMTEYPIAQAFKDARVTRIYGGTTEIMKMLIARTL
jgi:acyl-CoA dehydrogenase